MHSIYGLVEHLCDCRVHLSSRNRRVSDAIDNRILPRYHFTIFHHKSQEHWPIENFNDWHSLINHFGHTCMRSAGGSVVQIFPNAVFFPRGCCTGCAPDSTASTMTSSLSYCPGIRNRSHGRLRVSFGSTIRLTRLESSLIRLHLI